MQIQKHQPLLFISNSYLHVVSPVKPSHILRQRLEQETTKTTNTSDNLYIKIIKNKVLSDQQQCCLLSGNLENFLAYNRSYGKAASILGIYSKLSQDSTLFVLPQYSLMTKFKIINFLMKNYEFPNSCSYSFHSSSRQTPAFLWSKFRHYIKPGLATLTSNKSALRRRCQWIIACKKTKLLNQRENITKLVYSKRSRKYNTRRAAKKTFSMD